MYQFYLQTKFQPILFDFKFQSTNKMVQSILSCNQIGLYHSRFFLNIANLFFVNCFNCYGLHGIAIITIHSGYLFTTANGNPNWIQSKCQNMKIEKKNRKVSNKARITFQIIFMWKFEEKNQKYNEIKMNEWHLCDPIELYTNIGLMVRQLVPVFQCSLLRDWNGISGVQGLPLR